MNTAELEVKAAASSAPSSAPPFIPTRTYNIMAASYREAYGKKTDDELPGEPFMAGQMRKVENNMPKAELLTEVTSVEDGEDEITYAECGVTGVLKAHTRKVKQVPAPPNPEKLRNCYKVLENSYLYAMRKHGNVWWLADFTVGTYAELTDYLLGRKVMHLEAVEDDNGHVPWALILPEV